MPSVFQRCSLALLLALPSLTWLGCGGVVHEHGGDGGADAVSSSATAGGTDSTANSGTSSSSASSGPSTTSSASSSSSAVTSGTSSASGSGGNPVEQLPPHDPDDDCDFTPGAGCLEPPEEVVAAGDPEYQIHAVGVVGVGADVSEGCHPAGTFTLHVARPGSHTLVLSAYESVYWVVTTAPDATLDRVIIDGYQDAYYTLPPGTYVEEHTPGTGGYLVGGSHVFGTPETTLLLEYAQVKTGSEFASFHGGTCMSDLVIE